MENVTWPLFQCLEYTCRSIICLPSVDKFDRVSITGTRQVLRAPHFSAHAGHARPDKPLPYRNQPLKRKSNLAKMLARRFIPERLGNVFQSERPIDDRLELKGFQCANHRLLVSATTDNQALQLGLLGH